MKKIKLVLENGDSYVGESVGYDLTTEHSLGELVFNTSMTGYQEIITDPSYCDQIVLMTYPLIGNYGINKDDFESLTPSIQGLIVKEISKTPSNWRSEYSLTDYLIRFKIPAIQGIDTRSLTKKLRQTGVMKAVFVPVDYPFENISLLLAQPLPKNQIKKMSIKNPIHFPGDGKRIVLVDFGYKKNILRSLLQRKCDVVIVPWNSSFEFIESFKPQGVLLSNGPGNPEDIEEVLPVIKSIQEKYPLFCICMGHQLFALANGARTEKMRFGNRGANHPVKDLKRDRTFMTSQNHGYCVVSDSLQKTDLEITQINLNDKSIEGLKHKTLNAFSVQYHPEAAPGPQDTAYLFDDFLNMVRN